ncbi:MAG: hypothetical protein P8J66_01670, partial [Verrucomicrobiota bacterium]|nr:hypothetical protein [Verrucomicrobiota bacterium]
MYFNKPDQKKRRSQSQFILRLRLLLAVGTICISLNARSETSDLLQLSPFENFRYSVDLSTRFLHDSFPNKSGFQNAVGFD